MHENKKVSQTHCRWAFQTGGHEHKARKNPAVAAWLHPNSLLMSTKNTEKEYQIPNIIDRFMKETPTITSRRRIVSPDRCSSSAKLMPAIRSGPVTIGGEAAPMTVAGSPVSIILIISFLRIGEVSLAADKDY